MSDRNPMDGEHYLDKIFSDIRKEREKVVRYPEDDSFDTIIYKEEVESGEHHFKKALHFVEKEIGLSAARTKSCPFEHTESKIPMNLEDEFNKIMQQVFESIESRVSSKEITRAEADALKILINNKLFPAETFYEDANMDGWSQSQQCW